MEEKKVNEVFEFEGTTLQVVGTEEMNWNCKNCYFNYHKKCNIHCLPSERIDEKNVIFIKVEEK